MLIFIIFLIFIKKREWVCFFSKRATFFIFKPINLSKNASQARENYEHKHNSWSWVPACSEFWWKLSNIKYFAPELHEAGIIIAIWNWVGDIVAEISKIKSAQRAFWNH